MSADARKPLLEVQGISLAFGGLSASAPRSRRRRGRDRERHRAERRGQDDALQRDHGRLPSGRRRHRVRRRVDRRPRSAPDRAQGIARTFQTLRLFLNMTVSENVMAAAYGHTKAGVVRSVLRTPGMRREEREIKAARGGAARLLRPAARRLSLEPARIQPLVREPPAARDRARDCCEAEAAPARRAGRGDEPRRDARDHRAHRAPARRRRVHDPRHRARHARRRGDLGSRRRARPRREDRRGLVRAVATDPKVVEAYLGTSGKERK